MLKTFSFYIVKNQSPFRYDFFHLKEPLWSILLPYTALGQGPLAQACCPLGYCQPPEIQAPRPPVLRFNQVSSGPT